MFIVLRFSTANKKPVNIVKEVQKAHNEYGWACFPFPHNRAVNDEIYIKLLLHNLLAQIAGISYSQ